MAKLVMSSRALQVHFGRKNAHLLELCRYIVLNPVRAGMVDHPEKWVWSSYQYTSAGKGKPDFLVVDWILKQFARQKAHARQQYIQFVQEGCSLSRSPWEKLVGQSIYGGEHFVEKMCARLKRNRQSREIPKRQRQAGRPQISQSFPSTVQADKLLRNNVITKAHLEYGYTLKEIADQLELHYTTVSKLIANGYKNL